MSDNVGKSVYFYCLCIASTRPICPAPNLVVTNINKPQWDYASNRSINTAVVENFGSADAKQCIAHVIDPSTTQPSAATYNAIANIPALAAGKYDGDLLPAVLARQHRH